MTCAHCIALQRQVTDLQEEIAAWRAKDAGDARSDAENTRMTWYRWHLSIPESQARVLMLLVDNAGKPVRTERLFIATRTARTQGEVEDVRGLVAVMMSKLRRSLADHGLPGVILCARNVGFSISAATALRIKQKAGEA